MRTPCRQLRCPSRGDALRLGVLVAVWLAVGCRAPRPISPQERSFRFGPDTFAFANETQWRYGFDEAGRWTHERDASEPDYTHRCFVLVRAAKQFYLNARFEPGEPPAEEGTYRRLVRAVMGSDPRNAAAEADQVVIPGYRNLQEFSAAHERLLREECGGAWQSYVQRGHWRMIFPFGRGHQQATAEQLLDSVRAGRPAAVHVVCFPSLRINHALLVFDARETAAEMEFVVYDPNDAESPTRLVFDRGRRRFHFPANAYFPGGEVNVFEVYVSRCY